MKTGTDAASSGLYATECCLVEAIFAENQTLTRCPKCSQLTIWELVEEEFQLPRAA
jgi:hypothetical protein